MKRCLLAPLVLLLLLPSSASAARHTYTLSADGSDPQIEKLTFDVVLRRGEPKYVEDMEVEFKVKHCSPNEDTYFETWSSYVDDQAKIDEEGEFKYRTGAPYPQSSNRAVFKGDLHGGNRARGRFRWQITELPPWGKDGQTICNESFLWKAGTRDEG